VLVGEKVTVASELWSVLLWFAYSLIVNAFLEDCYFGQKELGVIMTKHKKKAPTVRVPRKLIEPVFSSSLEGIRSLNVDSSDDTEGSLDEFFFRRRPSLVQFRLDYNVIHPPGPVNTPKGGFVNKCPPPPAHGILKCRQENIQCF